MKYPLQIWIVSSVSLVPPIAQPFQTEAEAKQYAFDSKRNKGLTLTIASKILTLEVEDVEGVSDGINRVVFHTED